MEDNDLFSKLSRVSLTWQENELFSYLTNNAGQLAITKFRLVTNLLYHDRIQTQVQLPAVQVHEL